MRAFVSTKQPWTPCSGTLCSWVVPALSRRPNGNAGEGPEDTGGTPGVDFGSRPQIADGNWAFLYLAEMTG
ncbi:hypothetical protein DPEC_G00272260 [Dallia pectoralis]|uniref:Uncharacterized protein n=1 Tax=Dallia pectoralis TaxID=75939 RepID=A0ACC2FQ30_DALPE|nr:hypothetical protein DPEC_G00272260 [Dallia pectoralis]